MVSFEMNDRKIVLLLFSTQKDCSYHARRHLNEQICVVRKFVPLEFDQLCVSALRPRGPRVFKTREIGLGLTGFGIFFSFLGMIFFFDKGLLAMGNILFVSGVSLTIGPKSTMQFFMKRQNYKGTISFGVGFFFVVIGWPIIGMILESYGFVVLFSGFWPTLAVFLQRIPILGWVFQQPFIRSLLDRYRGRRVPV